MENQITKQDFIKFFPDETKAIEQSFDAPKRVSLSLPCKGSERKCFHQNSSVFLFTDNNIHRNIKNLKKVEI